jgi:hypothetical protein
MSAIDLTGLHVEHGGVQRVTVVGPLPDSVLALHDGPLAHRLRVLVRLDGGPQVKAAAAGGEVGQLEAGWIRAHQAGVDLVDGPVAAGLALALAHRPVAKLAHRPLVQRVTACIREHRALLLGHHDLEAGRHGHRLRLFLQARRALGPGRLAARMAEQWQRRETGQQQAVQGKSRHARISLK